MIYYLCMMTRVVVEDCNLIMFCYVLNLNVKGVVSISNLLFSPLIATETLTNRGLRVTSNINFSRWLHRYRKTRKITLK